MALKIKPFCKPKTKILHEKHDIVKNVREGICFKLT
jgi:hypothetical protein